VRLLCVWPKGVIASYLVFAFARKAWGDVIALEQAWCAASDVKSEGCRQGGLSGGGGLHRRRLAKHPRLPCGLMEEGVRVHLDALGLGFLLFRDDICLETCCACFSSEPFELVQHEGC
jgi:hypothetical protein